MGHAGRSSTFTTVLFLRVNMVAMWVFFIVLITVILLKQKQFATLGTMTLFFSLGILIALIPIAIYLFATDSAKDLWESYILFNLKYISKSTDSKLGATTYFFKLLILPIIAFILSVLKNRKNKLLLINAAAFLFAFYFVIISGHRYGHYGIVLLPYFALPTAALFHKDTFSITFPKHLLFTFSTIFLCTFIFSISQLYRFSDNKSASSIVSYLKANTQETDDVLVLGNDVHFNIEANRFTKQRFFYQSPICLINHAFFDEFQAQILSQKPDYIICPAVRVDFLQNEQLRTLLSELSPYYTEIPFTDGSILKNLR